MKKLISLLFVLALMCSCKQEPTSVGDIPITTNEILVAKMSIVVIDSCEYIQYKNYGAYSLTHKGNCKYCAERARQANQIRISL